MPRELVALKFQAGLHTKDNKEKKWTAGDAKYPDFNQVSEVARKGLDWSIYVDKHGIGMQYDTENGHQDDTPESPQGEQCCVVAVLQDFATEALTLFPELTQLTPAEFEDFYNNKAHVRESVELVDADVLTVIAAKEKAGLPVPEKAKAFDPDSPEAGIRKNHNKKWSDFKLKVGAEIV
jgi:hypothetical protein